MAGAPFARQIPPALPENIQRLMEEAQNRQSVDSEETGARKSWSE